MKKIKKCKKIKNKWKNKCKKHKNMSMKKNLKMEKEIINVYTAQFVHTLLQFTTCWIQDLSNIYVQDLTMSTQNIVLR
jgi:hypothetical protein